MDTVEEPLTLDYLCRLNGFISRNEALTWGALRTGSVGVSGTDYIPSQMAVKQALEGILDMEQKRPLHSS